MNLLGILLVLLDTNKHLKRKKDIATLAYEDFLNLRLQNPTKADICMHQCFKNSTLIVDKKLASENIAKLEEKPHLAFLKRLADSKSEELYKRTFNLRKKLIKADRFCPHSITPKMNVIKKILFKLI